MTKRTLKLPDGGTFELPMPDGFGAPVFALNGALQDPRTRTWIAYLLGAGVGVFTIWISRKLLA